MPIEATLEPEEPTLEDLWIGNIASPVDPDMEQLTLTVQPDSPLMSPSSVFHQPTEDHHSDSLAPPTPRPEFVATLVNTINYIALAVLELREIPDNLDAGDIISISGKVISLQMSETEDESWFWTGGYAQCTLEPVPGTRDFDTSFDHILTMSIPGALLRPLEPTSGYPGDDDWALGGHVFHDTDSRVPCRFTGLQVHNVMTELFKSMEREDLRASLSTLQESISFPYRNNLGKQTFW
ncbi:hypothetical protein BOTBODRAFT_55630 [Botryobasidium botryosum FD-172 SS1]|uniref:Uncharacterized protein n=1 Tax=Botryobasidium botryosum (strain FD-172 SS1) TaxID=930990 RepID=A0A067MHK1_BOTB1|nr:hypothetical protein BOTBODRAFT_55630 [Botryobasidium botryosum FD-172 SS1]